MKPKTQLAQLTQTQERIFHDEWAKATSLDEVMVVPAFEAATAPENRFILKSMGDLKHRRILDVGCGLGESSVYFAMQGAKVTASDMSPEMLRLTVELAAKYGVKLETVETSAETLQVAEGTYDFVYLGNIIHHVTDRPLLFANVHRALKPGGRFFSWDPLAYNPAIKMYRKLATDVRTVDESPLTYADIKVAGKYFSRVQHREFWILSLALFLKYYLIDRLNPNQTRYWKQILKEGKPAWWFRAAQAVDSVLTRIPGIRLLAWNMVMWGTK